MFKSLLRFVGIFMFIGVFASSAFAVTCTSNQYAGPNGTCVSCSTYFNTYAGRDVPPATCGYGKFVCPEGSGQYHFFVVGNNDQYGCMDTRIYTDSSTVSVTCGGTRVKDCRVVKKITNRTGCKYYYNSTTYENAITETLALPTDFVGGNDGQYQDLDGIWLNGYGGYNASAFTRHIGYSFQAMPGYIMNSSSGTCTLCTGHGFSTGGYNSECLECPYVGAQNPISSPSPDVNNNSYWALLSGGVNVTSGGTYEVATQGSSNSTHDGCIASFNASDDTGTYSTGTCTLDSGGIYAAGYGWYLGILWPQSNDGLTLMQQYVGKVCSLDNPSNASGEGYYRCIGGDNNFSAFSSDLEILYNCVMSDIDTGGPYLQVFCPNAVTAQRFLASLTAGAGVVDMYVD